MADRKPGAARAGSALAFPSAAGRAPPAGGPSGVRGAERGRAERSGAVQLSAALPEPSGPAAVTAAASRRARHVGRRRCRCGPSSSTCPAAPAAAMGLRREAPAPLPAPRAARWAGPAGGSA